MMPTNPPLIWYDLQDNAANATLIDKAGNYNATINSGNSSTYSTTGPFSAGNDTWLPKSIDFALSTGYMATTASFAGQAGSAAKTVCGWIKPVSGEQGYILAHNNTTGTDGWGFYFDEVTDTIQIFEGSGILRATSNAVFTDSDTWVHCAVVINASGHALFYRNGVAAGTVTGIGWTGAGTTQPVVLANRNGSSAAAAIVKSPLAQVMYFQEALTPSEIAEIYNGPELNNSVAPSIAVQGGGGPIVGSTLEVTSTGTWVLKESYSGSNGAPSYNYQWKRDGIDIGGETNSTYTVVAGDADKGITCRVGASNDGGEDTNERTDSNSITIESVASSSGGGLVAALVQPLVRSLVQGLTG